MTAQEAPRGGRADSGKTTLGIDLGGTKFVVALVDADGRLQASVRRPTRAERDPEAVIRDVVACVRQEFGVRIAEVAGLGVGVAGQVDDESGAVRFAPNLDWRDVPLGQRLQEALGTPVRVLNDVRAATVGEWLHGAGRGSDDLVCVFVGTGIGGGIVSDGELVRGHGNAAGEVGHMTVVAGGRSCHCRNRGCWEAYAGGWGVAERARERVRADRGAAGTLLQMAGAVDEITAETVGRAFHDGDPLATELIDETGAYLGAGLVGLAHAVNPGVLLLGGGVLEGIPELVERAERHLRDHALEAALRDLRIDTAALGGDAPVIGAAASAREAPEPGTTD